MVKYDLLSTEDVAIAIYVFIEKNMGKALPFEAKQYTILETLDYPKRRFSGAKKMRLP